MSNISAVIQSIFGSYTPIQDLVVEKVWDPVNENFVEVANYVTPAGTAGVNWEWIAGVFLFGLTLWSLFRLIGGIFSGK